MMIESNGVLTGQSSDSSALQSSTRRSSVIRLVLTVAGSIFVAEFLIMVGLSYFPLKPWQETLVDSLALSILVLPVLYAFVYLPLMVYAEAVELANHKLEENARNLEREIHAKTVDLQHVNERLEGRISELRQRDEQNALLSRMVEVLQSCIQAQEAYKVVKQTALQLFPGWRGGLSILSASRNNLESAISWGDSDMCRDVFAPEDCWALRLGRTYRVDTMKADPLCLHITCDKSQAYYCVPLMAQGDTLGILHLASGADSATVESVPAHHELAEQTVRIFSENVALALANLKLRESLRNQSIRDPLTGLFNRRYLEETLERELSRSRRRGVGIGVAMLDVDHFKEFNDTFGHAAGDAVLRIVAAYLRDHVRDSDIVCRYGGEEFTVIFPEALAPVVTQRCEDLRLGVQSLDMQHAGQALRTVTISLGLVIGADDRLDAQALLKAADSALYNAKSLGRNRVCLADAGHV